ncbi:hypothetical protein I7G86_07735 [Sinorhizobium meliloti]|uniref:hypothetical protein n=1 Tax=Rhizobium meliloti TaxID=382 RepID=UPI000FD3E165|nr:hypothetical protein [Sinorhizobium meliloti]MDE3771490.1 hypothetical protein [Sinorhizobium meliloti]MDE3790539.1 hypothetical protein [Sinorhizobium meliloti]MDW9709762.1 hypothetical protein [Sinorhizobium meliloti]MDW9748061.1 hypothetical protein [Sinorhizobium meliloti]MDW9803500.1 hypothetical protein [Sinorhizobium meliloti]
MSCNACRAAFAASDNKVSAVNNCIDQVCGCEKFSVSDYSPGRVQDDEFLHFLVYTPEGRSENGKLSPALLMQVDRDGLSVLRDGAADCEFDETMSALRPRWQTNGRSLEGIMTFAVSAVRHTPGGRFSCVYDTGMEKKPWHADLMLPELTATSKSQAKRLRFERLKALVDLIGNDFSDMKAFRNGRLAHLGENAAA